MTTKNPNIIRLYSHNINKLSLDNIAVVVTESLGILKDHGVDVMGWSETNVEWNSYPLHLATPQVFKQGFLQGKCITTTSEIPAATNFKLGGNAMGLHHNIKH